MTRDRPFHTVTQHRHRAARTLRPFELAAELAAKPAAELAADTPDGHKLLMNSHEFNYSVPGALRRLGSRGLSSGAAEQIQFINGCCHNAATRDTVTWCAA